MPQIRTLVGQPNSALNILKLDRIIKFGCLLRCISWLRSAETDQLGIRRNGFRHISYGADRENRLVYSKSVLPFAYVMLAGGSKLSIVGRVGGFSFRFYIPQLTMV